VELLPDDLLAKLEAQDPHHPSGPGRELTADEELVLAKWFTPGAGWTWYAVSASKDESGDVQFFGYVIGLDRELGYFWLSQLEKAYGFCGLPVERDLYWTPITLTKLLEEVERVGIV